MSFASGRLLSIIWLAVLLLQLAGSISAVAQAPQPAPAGAAKGEAPLSAVPSEISTALSKATAVLAEIEKGLQNISEAEGSLADYRAKAEEVLDITTETADRA